MCTVQGAIHAQGYSSAAGKIWQTGDELLHENEVSFPPRSGGEAVNHLFARLGCTLTSVILDTRIAPTTSLYGSPWQLCPGREQEAGQSVAEFHCQLYRDVDLVILCLDTDWSYRLCQY